MLPFQMLPISTDKAMQKISNVYNCQHVLNYVTKRTVYKTFKKYLCPGSNPDLQ